MLGQVVICGEKGKDLPNSETQRLVQNITLKLEKCNATSSAISLPFRNMLFACDEAFQFLAIS